MAQARDGVVINADSMQVYSELRILTARPSPAEEAAVPHRLYGHVTVADGYSVGRWLEEALAAMREAWDAEQLPIVTGGTGLYFRALENGLAPVPDIPQDLREGLRRELMEKGAAALHGRLRRLSPAEADRIRPSDGQRILRALEVLEATGEPLHAHHARQAGLSPLSGVEVGRILLMPERAELHRRADARLDAMVAEGVLDEVRRLLALGLDARRPAMKAIGVRPFARHLKGVLSLGEALALAKAETRQYIKRQATWFRNQAAGWTVRP